MRRWNRKRTAVLTLTALLALGTAACGDDGDDEAGPTTTTQGQVQGSPVVSIDMIDHAFRVSGPLIAGGTLRMANLGDEFHMMGIARFKPGKTLGDLQAVLSEQGPPGGGAPTTTAGGPTTTSAGGTSTTRATTTTTGPSTTTTRAGTATSGPSTTAAAGAPDGQGPPDDPTAEVVDEVGLPGHFMGPGQSVELTVPSLQPGTYALVCFIPTEGKGTPHFAEGMVAQLEVVPGPTPPAPTADATYRLAPGQAVEGPATLTAGRHTLRFDAAPGSGQLEPGIARINEGSSFARLDAALAALFESEEPPAPGAAGRVPGEVIFGGFDLGDVTTFYLATDFEPGNYAIVAEDTDVETPGVPEEILNVRVS